jgi:outer membrane protein assembly factor BamB
MVGVNLKRSLAALTFLAISAISTRATCAEPNAGGQAKAQPAQVAARNGIRVVLGLTEVGEAGVGSRYALKDGVIIYFQSPHAEEVLAMRKAAEAAGALGKWVFVDRGPWTEIHLGDNLADTIYVSPAAQGKVPEEELLRVLHPEGEAFIGDRRIAKPFPAGVDNWSHPFHGPDNNPQSRDQVARMPYRTQFLAGPMFSPMPEVTVAAAGRVFKAMGHIALKANQNVMLNTLLGINGYNGTVLWKRALREGFVIHRNTMIATPDVLYLGDDQSCKLLDARTGEVRGEIVVPRGLADGPVWKWMALETGPGGRDVLYALVGGEEVRPKTAPSQVPGLGHWPWSMWEGHEYKDLQTNFAFGRTFLAIDPATKKVLWHLREQDYVDGRGVAMKAGRIYYYGPEKFLACIDGSTGKVLWKNSDADLLQAIGPTGRAQNPTEGYATTGYLKCSDKYVFFAGPQRPNLVVASAADGKLVWQKRGGNLHLILRDDAFYGVGPGGGKMTYATWQTLAPLPNRRSCTRATGSLDSIFYRAHEGTMQICTIDDRAQHIAPMRPPCQDGVVIANGLLYWGPWMCGCPLSFYGHIAVGPAAKPGLQIADSARLEPGAGDPNIVEPLPLQPGDWPCSAADSRRTSATTVAVPQKVKRLWTFETPSAARPTAPVAAGNLVLAGDDRGVLRALDAASGKVKWQAFTAGAIYQAPAVWQGRVYVGSADGRVYAFEAATGRRLWTFWAAPADRWIPVYGRLISAWPVSGGVVVEDGVLYAAAGLSHYDGTHVYALDAATGKVRWHNRDSGRLSDQVASGISLQGELFRDGDALCFAGGSIYQTARYDLKTGQCLNEPLHAVNSVHATAFYPYYPEYGQYVSLDHRLPDGQRLSYAAAYEGSQHTPLMLLKAPKPGEQQPPPRRKPEVRRPGTQPANAVWESRLPGRYNSFIVGPDAVVAAGQRTEQDRVKPFLAGIRLKDGAEVWMEELPAPVVRRGTAIDAARRIVGALDDGRLMCFGPAAD